MKLPIIVALLLLASFAGSAELANVVVKQKIIPSGSSFTCFVVLDDRTNTPETIALSDNTSAVETPVSITITGGNYGDFNCTTSPVTTPVIRSITGTLRAVTKTAYFTLVPPPKLGRFELVKADVVGGESVPYLIEITSPAPSPNAHVTLTTNSAAVSNGGANLPGGTTVFTGSLSTSMVSANATRTITAAYAGQTIARNVTLHKSPVLVSMKTSSGIIGSGIPLTIEFEVSLSDIPLTNGFAPNFVLGDNLVNIEYITIPGKPYGSSTLTLQIGEPGFDPGPSRMVTIEGKLGGVTKTVTVFMLIDWIP